MAIDGARVMRSLSTSRASPQPYLEYDGPALMKLPFLGLGLSSNMDVRGRPHPYQMLDTDPDLFDYVEYSALLLIYLARSEASSLAEMEVRLESTPVLFHPVHLNQYGPELEADRSL